VNLHPDGTTASAAAGFTYVSDLALSPTASTLPEGGTVTLAASGGLGPYVLSQASGIGTFDLSTGVYTAPFSTGTAVLQVTDAFGDTTTATVTVRAIAILPASKTVGVNSQVTFSATDGIAPYAYSIASGGGSIGASTGAFVAPSSAGTTIVRVTDSVGVHADATVTIGPALAITPTSKTLAVGNTFAFAGSNGAPPYSYSLVSGTGSITTAGVYTAPAASGSAVVRITDSTGEMADAAITVNAGLAITPTTATLAAGNGQTFTASAGVAPYAYSMASGTGSVGAATGAYVSVTPGTDVVRATDSIGNTRDAVVTVNAPLGITPATLDLAVGNTKVFSAAGGVAPYAYTLQSGTGSLSGTTYTAPGAAGSATVRVTDALGNTSDCAVTVHAAVALSPSSKTLAVNNVFTFSATGGVGPFSYTKTSGVGSISASSGIYIAPATTGTATLRVTDSLGNTATGTVTVNAALAISPTTQVMAASTSRVFSAAGGVTPYVFSRTGTGTINSSTGAYTAPGAAASVTVTVTDAVGNTKTASVTVKAPLVISPATKSLAVGNAATFSTTGGLTPYVYSVFSGGGAIDSATGAYVAPATSGAVTVRVTDALGSTADAAVTVNPALSVTPSAKTLAINNAFTFAGTDGVSPYSYAMRSGSGTINATTGAYVAPTGTGTDVIRVTDSLGNVADSTITINPALAITPTTQTLAVGNTATFASTGGAAPFTYSVATGTGTVDATTGVYTAPGAAGTATVRVTDSMGNTADAAVTINAALAISPTSKSLAPGNAATFSASGGVTPYVFSISAGGGSVNATTGVYTAGSAGSTTVRVTDALGNVASAAVTVNAALAITPSSKTLAVSNAVTFTASGGVSPYVYSIQFGGGTLDASTGAYTAPGSSGTASVRVTDSLGNVADAAITVNAALAISPASKSLAVNNTTTFSGTGGVGPYSYAVTAGSGTIHSSSGAYTAPAASGTDTVRVTDSLGNTSSATVTVNAALSISPSSYTMAAGNSHTFAGAGGVAPYTYAVTSGGGTVDATGGGYTAAATSGTANVRVTDALGNVANASITVNAALAITPVTKSLAVNNTFSFAASGGVTPYTYSVQAGTGTINASTGLYTAPAAAGSATVRVTDAIGNVADSAVTINAALAIAPASKTLAVGNTVTLVASGGVTPYTYSRPSGTGSVGASTGVYTAPASAGTATVRVTDAVGNTADSAVTINAALAITPTSKTLAVNNTFTFAASGGVSGYTFSVASGSGTIDSSTGAYVAPPSGGTDLVRVTDSLGNMADAVVTVNAALAITPTSKTLAVGNVTTFAVSGGASPYIFSVQAGTGTVNSTTGVYTAPAAAGTATVRVTDAVGNTADAAVTVNAALAISPASRTIASGNGVSFSASGGVSPYVYSVASGGGSVSAAGGAYVSGGAGAVTVRVTDTVGNTSDAAVTVNAALSVSPATQTLAVGNVVTFAASGGVSPYAYALHAGVGSVDASTGEYTAPASAGTATVRVTDASGNVADAAVTINAALAITPVSKALAVNNTQTFGVSGGVGPYAFDVSAGTGTVNASSGLYTAPAAAGTATVRVTDALGNASTAAVTINAAVAISPSTKTIAGGGTIAFSAAGGVSPYVYSVFAGGGSVGASSGSYTAATSSGAATVRVTDALGNVSDAAVTINGVLGLTPSTKTLAVGNSATFTALTGVPPYTYSVAAGGGAIDSSTGVYTAPAAAGTATVRVTDSASNTADAAVTINAVLAISPTSKILAVGNATTFTATGGVSPYTYDVTAGTGSVDANSGLYTAPGASGTATVTVTDALGNTSAASVTINAALAISPSSTTMAVSNTHTFSASGGVGPYTYAVIAGGGSIDATGGGYTAAATSGTATVRVTDSLGNTSTASVTVNGGLAISPTSKTLAVNNTYIFAASGGVSPYAYSLNAGTGTVDSSTGLYTAPAAAGTATVRATDAVGNVADATVTVNAALAVAPSTKTLAVNNTVTLVASGGASPYTFSRPSGTGTINASTGVYVAPAASGTATLRVTDSVGNTADSAITVNAGLAISPASKTLAVNNAFTFSASGGVSVYVFSVLSGSGTINASTGAYVAPPTGGTDVVRVTDSLGNTSDATVTINAGLAITPTTKTLAVNNTTTFAVSGGASPYVFSVQAGTGTVNSSTGVYTAPAAAGSATVRVTDAVGNTTDAAVTVNAALAISPASRTVASGNSLTFTASGGVSPYVYSVASGGGSVDATTGAYVSGGAGSATVRATDSLGNVSDAAITINAALTISPASKVLAVGNTTTFAGSGGVSPYAYSIQAGVGTVDSSTGVYTAPASAGSATVRVTDASGNVADAAVTVNAALALSPASKSLAVNNTQAFAASGGVAPYAFDVSAGTGAVDASSGLYTAPAAVGTATVRVTDALGNVSTSAVTVTAALAISPSSKTIAGGGATSFSASGGVSPYAYSLHAGGGSIGASTGAYTAPTSSGSATVRVTDALGNVSDAAVTINGVLGLTPSTKTLAVGNSATFSAVTGVPPYAYSVTAGGGSIDSSTGVYTAPAAAGTATVRVTDSASNTADAIVTINAAVAISPTTKTLAVNNTVTFSATQGVPPYSYDVSVGTGTIDASSGLYTAPAAAGTATVRVTDALGNVSTAAVTVNAALAISPSTYTMSVGNSRTFAGSGGVGPYTYAVTSGGGTVDSTGGGYTAAATSGTATVRVTDALGNTQSATITINAGLSISPATKSLAVNNAFTFAASGGVSPYVYSVPTGTGTIDASTGEYTAPAASGTATVRVTDAVGNTADAAVTIKAALTLSPTSKTLAAGGTQTFAASGGVTPYTYSRSAGTGTVDSSTGVYTAPGASGTATVLVTDALGNTASASVTVNAALAISPSSRTVAVNNTITFGASGGVSTYAYSILSGSGTIDSSTGVYTAPPSAGTDVVRVSDSIGNTSDATVTVNAGLAISPTSLTLAVNNTSTFSVTGGASPYVFSVSAGTGTVNASTGAYTAPAAAGSATVLVTDARGNTASAAVTVRAALAISPSSQTVATGNSISFSAANGVSPYAYSVVSGGGTVNASSGVYTAGSVGTTTVRATDSLGNVSDATITVNAALLISPSTRTLAAGNSVTFSATGGVSGYTFSIASGGGSVDSSTGAYTAPASAGSATVRVTDTAGNVSDAAVTINAVLSLSPLSKTLAVNNAVTFSAAGGVAPYTYDLSAGTGTVHSTSGLYTAPAAAGSATVRVTDSLGNTATAAVTVNAALAISPSTKTIAGGGTTTFAASGGVSPYVYTLFAGGGSIDATTGYYTAPTSSGAGTVRVTDSLGNVSDAAITINGVLGLSPSTKTLAVGNSATFAALSGVSPYAYSLVSGGGGIDASTGVYTAAASAGTATVRVTDSASNTADAVVTINAALAISPTAKSLAVNNTFSFTATGGVAPYAYDLAAGTGTIHATSGLYTAPAAAGTATVRVTDSLGNIATAAVTVNAALAISPSVPALGAGNSTAFSASGGVSPYTYAVVSGAGSIHATTGVFTAGGAAGSVTVRVNDSLGNTSDASVTVNATLSISPSTQVLAVGNTVTFAGSGGVTAYAYAVVSGVGAIDATTGVYTAPATAGSAIVRVTDSLGNVSDATVTVNAALAISPSTKTLAVNNVFAFGASGGVAPYAYSKVSGTGTIDASSGAYTAPAAAGTATVRVTDFLGNTSDATITVNAALAISPSSKTLSIGNAFTFSASGGVPSYAYAVSAGVGTINAATGAYTAPGAIGTATVTVTDGFGNTSSAAVTVSGGLALSPSAKTLAVNNVTTFVASGGVSAYVYSVASGGGSIDASTGVYTAPAASGTAIVRVTDALGNVSDAAVTINAALAISPSTRSLAVDNVFAFAATGGVSPYTYSIQAGTGTVNASSGAYTAPAAAGTATVRVTDAFGNVSDAAVTINAALAISPSSLSLAVGNSTTFTATGGVLPYAYAVSAGTGTVGASSGLYVAPGASGTATVTVTDAFGNTSSSAVTIGAALQISPATLVLIGGNSATFSASGGVSGYTYSIASGAGTIDASTGVYTSAMTSGNQTIRVTDALGNTSDASVRVYAWSARQAYQYSADEDAQALGLALDASGRLLAAGAAISAASQRWVIQRSTNAASSWTVVDDYQLSSGQDSVARAVGVTGAGKYYAVGSGTSGANAHWIARKSADGVTWSASDDFELSAGADAAALAFGFDGSDSAYAAGYGSDGGDEHWLVRKSADEGASWSGVDDYQRVADQSARATAFAKDGAGNLFVGGFAQDASGFPRWIVRKSVNDGSSWSTISDFTYAASQPSRVAGAAVDASGNVYVVGAGTDGSGITHWVVRKSGDSGATWSTVDDYNYSSGKDAAATSVTVDASANVYVSGYGKTAAGVKSWIVRKSADGGVTWVQIEGYHFAASQDATSNAIVVDSSGDLFCGGTGSDGGDYSWLMRRYVP
jgi:hypothetical protein